jgi:hypothetical protein
VTFSSQLTILDHYHLDTTRSVCAAPRPAALRRPGFHTVKLASASREANRLAKAVQRQDLCHVLGITQPGTGTCNQNGLYGAPHTSSGPFRRALNALWEEPLTNRLTLISALPVSRY